MINNSRNSSYDLLRGVAILGVISVHVAQSFPTGSRLLDQILGFGRFGVQIFFFVSALTMCYMWEQRSGESGRVLKFYTRRFFRIAPLFWLAMLGYLLLSAAARDSAESSIALHQVILTALFLHGFWPDSINAVVPGGWTIAVEMTFYLLFPWLVSTLKNKIWFLPAAMAVYLANVVVFEPLLTHLIAAEAGVLKNFLFMNFLTQMPVFLLGCYMYGEINGQLYWSNSLTGLAFLCWGATALLANYYLQPLTQNFKFLLVVMGLYWFVKWVLHERMEFSLLERLGRNSYAIYLVHFVVISGLVMLFERVGLGRTGMLSFLLAIVGVTTIAYTFSVLSYHLLEKKIQIFVNKITG